MKRSISIIFVMLLIVSLITGLVACGSGGKDAVAGTWTTEDEDFGSVTWTFNGKGGCTLKHDTTDQKGTYELTDDTVTISMELWENPIAYNYTVGDGTLSLKDSAGMAPEYDLNKK